MTQNYWEDGDTRELADPEDPPKYDFSGPFEGWDDYVNTPGIDIDEEFTVHYPKVVNYEVDPHQIPGVDIPDLGRLTRHEYAMDVTWTPRGAKTEEKSDHTLDYRYGKYQEMLKWVDQGIEYRTIFDNMTYSEEQLDTLASVIRVYGY